MKKMIAAALAFAMLFGSSAVQAAEGGEADMSRYNIVTSAETHKVIFDSDIRFLTDDMYCLLELLQADKAGYLDLLGITTASPGLPVEEEAKMALSMLEKVDRTDVPVYVGTDTPLDEPWYEDEEIVSKYKLWVTASMKAAMGQAEEVNYDSLLGGVHDEAWAETSLEPQRDKEAWEYMVEQVKEYPGQVTIISVGSCTNIALAIQNDPDFAENTAGIYYMGGACPENIKNMGSGVFNWYHDVKAVNICLQADFPKQVLIPWEISYYQKLDKEVMDRIAENNHTPVSELITDLAYPGFVENPDKKQSFWDAGVPAIFMMPDIIETSGTRYMMENEEIGFYFSALKQWEEGNQPEGLKPIQVVWNVDSDIYWDFMVDLYTTNF